MPTGVTPLLLGPPCPMSTRLGALNVPPPMAALEKMRYRVGCGFLRGAVEGMGRGKNSFDIYYTKNVSHLILIIVFSLLSFRKPIISDLKSIG